MAANRAIISSPKVDIPLGSDPGYAEWDVEKNIVILSPYLKEILAFDSEELVQSIDAWFKICHPDDVQRARQTLEKFRSSNGPYIISESRKKCRDGKWRWFLIRGKVIEFSESGQPLRMVGTCSDITYIKERETEHLESKHLFGEIKRIQEYYIKGCSLSEISSVILNSFKTITKSEGHIFIFAEECDYKNFQSFSDKGFNQEKRNFIIDVLKHRNNHIQNAKNLSYLGIYLSLPFQKCAVIFLERDSYFDTSILNFLDPMIGTSMHLISLRKHERKSVETNEIVSLFFRQIPTPVAMLDTEMRYLFASKAWGREFGFGEDYDFKGKPHYDLFPNLKKEWLELHKECLKGKIHKGADEEIEALDGSTLWITGEIHPWYTADGEIGGLVIFSEIITERKKTEFRLKKMVEDLTLSNQGLERFAHICSHDLKEPLRTISGLIQLLRRHNPDVFDDISQDYIHHILKGLDRMNTMIKGILVYSKIPSNVCSNSFIDINIVLEEARESLELKFFEANACIRSKRMPVILGDKTQIMQIFMNLIENALKFRSDHPLVIDISSIEKKEFWEFSIKDNGIGISENYRDGIFDMFKRLHTKDQYEGSGIGLSICKKIVQMHGGDIYVKATPEGGSDFTFTLPKIKNKDV
jgi:PAS domain S-box-containing protein